MPLLVLRVALVQILVLEIFSVTAVNASSSDRYDSSDLLLNNIDIHVFSKPKLKNQNTVNNRSEHHDDKTHNDHIRLR